MMQLPAETAPEQAPVCNQRTPVYATGPDWEQYRVRISTLYETHTLKDVMRIMERDHRFKGTVSMYKKHFAAWGLAKYNREAEMKAAARQFGKGSLKSPTNKVFVRGKEISPEEVARYFRRKNCCNEDVFNSRDGAKTPPTVRSTILAPRPLLFIPKAVSTPETLLTIQGALSFMEKYVTGSLDAGNWVSSSDNKFIHSRAESDKQTSARNANFLHIAYRDPYLLDFPGRHSRDYLLLSTLDILPISTLDSLSVSAHRISAVHCLVELEHPPLLDRILRNLLDLFNLGKPKLARVTCLLFACMFKKCHSEKHPFYLVCSYLLKLGSQDFVEVLGRITSMVYNGFSRRLGPYHRTTLAARCTYACNFVSRSGHSTEADELRKIIEECERSLPEGDLRTLRARENLGSFYFRIKDLKASQIEAQNIINKTFNKVISGEGQERDLVLLCAKAYSDLANCEHNLDNMEKALTQKYICIGLHETLGPGTSLISLENAVCLMESSKEYFDLCIPRGKHFNLSNETADNLREYEGLTYDHPYRVMTEITLCLEIYKKVLGTIREQMEETRKAVQKVETLLEQTQSESLTNISGLPYQMTLDSFE